MLNGECPTNKCPAGTCGSNDICLNGFCYDDDWYALTFPNNDGSGISQNPPVECKPDVDECETSLDCPDPQRVGVGTPAQATVVWQCEPMWSLHCQNADEGGATKACRRGVNPAGNCIAGPPNDCAPTECPQPGVGLQVSYCPNGQECHVSSSDISCGSDDICQVGEMCSIAGKCRTICADGIECSPWWGGVKRACRPYPLDNAIGSYPSTNLASHTQSTLNLTLTGPGIGGAP